MLPLAVSGCSRASAAIEKTVHAEGMLMHHGRPLPHYQVMFTPEDGRRPAAGVTDEHGKFVLGTNGAGDGAPAGKHRVCVTYVGPPSGGADGMNSFAPPPPPKIKIAAKFGNPESSGLTQEISASGSSDLKVDLP